MGNPVSWFEIISPPGVRRAILDRAAGRPTRGLMDDHLAAFVDLVANDAPAVTDDDVERLLLAGHDEEAVFEAVVAAALGASLIRLERVDVLLESGA